MDVTGAGPIRLRWLLPLSFTVMAGFGVILYGFSIYVTDEAAGSVFSKTVLSVAYGGSVIVGGLLALPVGRYADRHGVRAIVGTGAVLGSSGLALFALSQQPWHVVAVWWLVLGPAQALIYYEPAYVAINQWCHPRDRARALAMVTLIGGLAGVVFIPVAERLVTALGWEAGVLVLASLLLLVGVTTSVFALPGRRERRDHGEQSSRERIPLSRYLGDQRFLLYTLAMTISFLAAQGVIAHRVARFEEAGFSVATVALWAAAASLMSLPGRWVAPLLAARFGATRVQAVVTAIVALGVLLMLDGSSFWEMVGHFSLFGLAFGASLPLRAQVMSDWYAGPDYGQIMGAQWTVAVFIGGIGPAFVGVLRDMAGDYQVSVLVLTALLVAATVAIATSGRIGEGAAAGHA